jgi:hypothetical protein
MMQKASSRLSAPAIPTMTFPKDCRRRRRCFRRHSSSFGGSKDHAIATRTITFGIVSVSIVIITISVVASSGGTSRRRQW